MIANALHYYWIKQWLIDVPTVLVSYSHDSLEHRRWVLEFAMMVCTEKYVPKTDDRTGGVGYEAMIVTGELMRDLGTAKFIPVDRIKSANVAAINVSTHVPALISEAQGFVRRRRPI